MGFRFRGEFVFLGQEGDGRLRLRLRPDAGWYEMAGDEGAMDEGTALMGSARAWCLSAVLARAMVFGTACRCSGASSEFCGAGDEMWASRRYWGGIFGAEGLNEAGDVGAGVGGAACGRWRGWVLDVGGGGEGCGWACLL